MSNQVNTNINTSSGNYAPVMSIGDWIVTLLIFCIPFVNLIMVLVWAFSSNSNPNRANYCKAYLIIGVIVMILGFAFAVMFGSILASAVPQN
ncbi:hypothetical protein BGI30_00905 [Snodgrassella alvi]|jgi:Na+/phosphate symporter|uniref:hypothetical protein n=1 Tax=Snodgrassella alvi TaxID=1196083 RepID=UPI000C1E6B12|nr:hypothetical protein [Snodgrassella alvi]PIT13739.1 hypothetical protein BGI30_00905 [Snodgrassella alvi]PIT22529.1 hypothetical protein BGI37_13605 [Snodgrassella alvi]PIT55871.1 hypothetical protein BHC59_10210 [Snodgrassella alvi]